MKVFRVASALKVYWRVSEHTLAIPGRGQEEGGWEWGGLGCIESAVLAIRLTQACLHCLADNKRSEELLQIKMVVIL